MTTTLRFGIAELDDLFSHGEQITQNRCTATIIGPDGCGKSILALHLASTYEYDLSIRHHAEAENPRVIYISTDLSYEQALSQWKSFGLNYPRNREQTLRRAFNGEHGLTATRESEMPLRRLTPNEGAPITDIGSFLWENHNYGVYFLDLQSETAGDDWGFVNSLFGVKRGISGFHDLFIIDAVEGLETFSGNQDAYGLVRDRRSRISQLIRNAARANAHVLFVVEEITANERLPELFVTDLVIRLRMHVDGMHSQRTLEIEKCRAAAHATGQHELAIQNGDGSFTGASSHLDDPRIEWIKQGSPRKPNRRIAKKHSNLAYVRVIPSLHQFAAKVLRQSAPLPELGHYPTFLGLPEFDSFAHAVVPFGSEGTLTLLLGNPGTHKGWLSRAFLGGAFEHGGKDKGVAILITTRFMDAGILSNRLAHHIHNAGVSDHGSSLKDISTAIADDILCQRLSIRQITSGSFLDVIHRYIGAAQQRVFERVNGRSISLSAIREMSPEKRRTFSGKIRIVIEDLTELSAMYPALRNDPLLVNTFVTLLKREGVKSLLVSTVPGLPGLQNSVRPQDVRSFDEPQIRTWTVDFYGETRIAVTFRPYEIAGRSSRIFEIAPRKSQTAPAETSDENVTITREFDFYADVDLGQPKRIPLELILYSGTYGELNPGSSQFLRILHHTIDGVFPGRGDGSVIRLKPCGDYDEIFTFVGTTGPQKLEHTLIFQVDEFWSQHTQCLADLSTYLSKEDIWSAEYSNYEPQQLVRHANRDNAGLYMPFQDVFLAPASNVAPLTSSRPRVSGTFDGEGVFTFRRHHFFQSHEDGGPPDEVARESLDRIPYLWDFGMILADKTLWTRYRQDKVVVGGKELSLGVIWNSLCVKDAWIGERCERQRVGWMPFLEACNIIARHENIAAFDVDLNTTESFSCLVLEIWGDLVVKLVAEDAATFWRRASTRGDEKTCLWELCSSHRLELIQSLVLLTAMCSHLESRDRQVFRQHASHRAAASREWYQTMSAIKRRPHEGNLVPLRVPGCYAVRGDWALAMAEGSRSQALGHRVMDLLSSRRQQLLRLYEGFGLPVRDILPDCTIGQLPTAIAFKDDLGQKDVRVKYSDICELGRSASLSWLWRSQLDHYDRDTFFWRRWLARMIEEKHEWLNPQGASVLYEMPKDEFMEIWNAREEDVRSKKGGPLIKKVQPRIERLESSLRRRISVRNS